MSEEHNTVMLNQIMSNQTELFAEIKEINKNLIIIARLEERQLNDRSTISRIGDEVRSNTESTKLLSIRMTALETNSSGRGKIFQWLSIIAASIISSSVVAGIILWIQKIPLPK